MSRTIKVIRVLEYEGDEDAVNKQLAHGYLHPGQTRPGQLGVTITEQPRKFYELLYVQEGAEPHAEPTDL